MAFKPYRPKPPGNRPPGSSGGPRPFNRGPRPPEHNINSFIRANEVRLVGDNLAEISEVAGQTVETGVYPTSRLQKWAEELGLDVVEISPNADPPVVRIVDYNKFLYQKRKREKEMKANTTKVELKEIRFGPETGEHDFEFKVRHAKNFLAEGNKVKAFASSALKGKIAINVSKGVRNADGLDLKAPFATTLEFDDLKPEVRLVGKGVIMPRAETLPFIFEGDCAFRG